MKEPTKKGALEIGQLFHRVFENPTSYSLHKIWNEIFGEEEPTEEKYQYHNIEVILDAWYQQQHAIYEQMTWIASEEYFEIPFGDIAGYSVVYYGTIDARVEWKGLHYLVDLKTTGRLDDDKERGWRMSSQFKGYCWAASQLGYDNIKGVLIPAVEIKKVPPYDRNLSKKCSVHKTKYSECQVAHVKTKIGGPFRFSNNQIIQWKEDTFRTVADAIHIKDTWERHKILPRMDGTWLWPGCERCQFQPWCEAGRPLGGVEQLMVHVPWMRGPVKEVSEDE